MVGHLPALRRYALGLSGDRQTANDLVQDCVERALRRMDTLANEQRLGAWLRSILFNLFIDSRRTSRGRGEIVEDRLLEDLEDKIQGPDLRQEANEVLRATVTLTSKHRQVLLLIAAEGLSYREVAEELGVPIGTVMSRLARAREQLRATLIDKPHRFPTVVVSRTETMTSPFAYPTENELHAYIDDELEPSRRAEIASVLRDDPASRRGSPPTRPIASCCGWLSAESPANRFPPPGQRGSKRS